MLRTQSAGKKQQLQEPQKVKPQLADQAHKSKFSNKEQQYKQLQGILKAQ